MQVAQYILHFGSHFGRVHLRPRCSLVQPDWTRKHQSRCVNGQGYPAWLNALQTLTQPSETQLLSYCAHGTQGVWCMWAVRKTSPQLMESLAGAACRLNMQTAGQQAEM